jgi:hypothetical protein
MSPCRSQFLLPTSGTPENLQRRKKNGRENVTCARKQNVKASLFLERGEK